MAQLRTDSPADLDGFFAFTEHRPDGEKWEFIDGQAILNASPTRLHQRIVGNLIVALHRISVEQGVWEVLPGLAVIVEDRDAPVPDVIIRPNTMVAGNLCDDMIVAFEVLSPSTKTRDLGWKQRAYATVPSLLRYVVIAQETVDVRWYARANAWQLERTSGLSLCVPLAELDVVLTLEDIYATTGLSDS